MSLFITVGIHLLGNGSGTVKKEACKKYVNRSLWIPDYIMKGNRDDGWSISVSRRISLSTFASVTHHFIDHQSI